MPDCGLAFGSVRTRQKDPVGVLGQRGPGLVAVDNVIVALTHRR